MKSIKKRVLTIIATIMMMGFVTSVMAQVPDTQEESETYPQEQQEQETTPPDMQTLPQDEQEHMRPQEEGVDPQEQNQMGEVEYDEELEENELPATVSTSLETMYADYDVDKVYQGTDDSYKV
ncbi:MAG: hypothetical protein ACOC0R_03165, partial [Mariniphaga sp.]